MFGLHLVHGTHPQLFQENVRDLLFLPSCLYVFICLQEWELFLGIADTEGVRHQDSLKQVKESLPPWCDPQQVQTVANLKVYTCYHGN